jgi:glycosyltransferase involved in cell wall biosynthesis
MNVLACLASPVPVIVSEHTDPRHQPLSRSWRWARTKLYRRAAAGIGLTEGAAAAIRRWIPHAPIVVIPPAIDPPSGGWHDGGRNDGPPWTLAAVGRLSPEKGIDRLISAFAKSQAPHRGWRLQLAGDGPERTRLAEQAAQLQCSHAIEFLGWQADVWAVLARAHALVLSSHYEGFPLALLEGMAAGLPCLSVDCPSGPRELITDNATGLLVPSSIEGLRGGIDQLVNDAGLRDRLGRAARAVRTRYTWERFVTAHESLCEQSLERSLG